MSESVDINKILNLLPHRYPFILVDRVLDYKVFDYLDAIKNALPYYFDALAKASKTKDYTMANTMFLGLENFQKKYGKAVRPSDQQISSEILLNKYDVFKNLFWLVVFVYLAYLFMKKVLPLAKKSL